MFSSASDAASTVSAAESAGIAWRSAAHSPKSISWHLRLQNGRHASLSSQATCLRQVGQLTWRIGLLVVSEGIDGMVAFIGKTLVKVKACAYLLPQRTDIAVIVDDIVSAPESFVAR